MGKRTESGKYKQWDCCVERNYLPRPLACVQQENVHLFCIESDLQDKRGGGARSETEKETGKACEPLTGCERADEREGVRGRGSTVSESFKPVNGLGDAEQDVEEMLCPCHGLLQAETELEAAERHSVTFLCEKRHTLRILPTKRRALSVELYRYPTKP